MNQMMKLERKRMRNMAMPIGSEKVSDCDDIRESKDGECELNERDR
jgi:hypothetical protein